MGLLSIFRPALLVLLICSSLSAAFTQAAEPPDTLRIATYNVANYCATDRMTEDGYRNDYPKPEKAKTALRTVLREIDPDIVCLQEIGELPYLNELRRDLKREGLDYPYFSLGEGDDPDRHLAVLSKRPLARTESHQELEIKYLGTTQPLKRGVLEVSVKTSIGELTLWIVHLKSKLTERAEDPESQLRRAAEAVAIRDLILKKQKQAGSGLYLILGDFNDSKTSRPLRALQARGKTEIGHLLEASDSADEHWTFHSSREDSYERLDHILASPALKEAAGGKRPLAATITRHPQALEASDHRPLYVDLRFDR